MGEFFETTVRDPAGHIKIAVGSLAVSRPFYELLFGALGSEYQQIKDKPNGAAWVTPHGFGIWIAEAAVQDYPHQHEAPGLHHLCLKAGSRDGVDGLHRVLVEAGTQIDLPPQSFPQYTNDYYAVFFRDPDGIKLEVAHY